MGVTLFCLRVLKVSQQRFMGQQERFVDGVFCLCQDSYPLSKKSLGQQNDLRKYLFSGKDDAFLTAKHIPHPRDIAVGVILIRPVQNILKHQKLYRLID